MYVLTYNIKNMVQELHNYMPVHDCGAFKPQGICNILDDIALIVSKHMEREWEQEHLMD